LSGLLHSDWIAALHSINQSGSASLVQQSTLTFSIQNTAAY